MGVAMGVSHVFVAAGVPADPDVTFLPYPNPIRPHTGDSRTVLTDLQFRVHDELTRGDVACVIVEPIQSDGGLVIPPQGFMAMLAEACRTHDVPLIVDEVKVGLGRTGYLFACDYDGINPDIITLGKSLGGGLPLSAAVGPAWILDDSTASSLLTSAGNPVCAAAGLAVLSEIQSHKLTQRAGALGETFRQLLEAGVDSRGLRDRVGSVRGRGLTIGIDLVQGGDLGSPNPMLARKTVFRAWQLGAVVFYVGDHVIEVTPPLILTDDEMHESVEILLTALNEAERVTDDEIAPYAGW
jgi:4-aminobutyrate aminotransferase